MKRLCLWVVLAAPLWPADGSVTFSNQVVRLLQAHCQVCHHSGGLGPFPLLTYDDALTHARTIVPAVQSRRMPDGAVVRLDTGCCSPDTFEGIRRLTSEEIDTLVQWFATGAPEGNPAELPPQLTFSDGLWKGGEPETVVPNAAEGFLVPARLGRDVFRRFPVQTHFNSERYLTSFEALPGSGDDRDEGLTRIVHHVTLFIDPECQSLGQEAEFAAAHPEVPGPGFEGEFKYPTSLVGMWFPGSAPLQMPDGVGIRVPRDSCLVMEVHYATYNAEPVVDRTVVGLKWASAPVEKERLAVLAKNEDFIVPAGDARYQVQARLRLPQDATLYSVTPHMHQLGTDFLVQAVLPDGSRSCLADVEWDFRHQGTHTFRQPVRLAAGTEVEVSCVYNNSANNPHQDHQPPIAVPWGRDAEKEMCQLTLGLTFDATR